ncbi:MAG: carotenoid 1,2-hydratase [Phyllobacteriaceae bacterium]|nr:carotenoid 1,2-hydratase [Phyllobacteriaceae bacterium]MBA91097.1 carotenoid 1,2-hydratase [Phyllobacteriaceae bacterium]
MIAFVGSVFSTWYHFAGRRDPDNHVALNVVLYTPQGDYWAMTERGRHSQARSSSRFRIGPSMVQHVDGGLVIDFDEIAPPFPPRRLRPRRLRGRIVLTPRLECGTTFALDPEGRHKWWPVAPAARVRVESNVLAGGGWEGSGYHDLNWGTRPLETDFRGWDWSRGQTPDGGAMVLYDARLRDGTRRNLALRFSGDGTPPAAFDVPERKPLKRGWWGVEGGIACDADSQPRILRALEDTPFYTRSVVETEIGGETRSMMHETLDCGRLANPVVRLMLPFRMPRRA